MHSLAMQGMSARLETHEMRIEDDVRGIMVLRVLDARGRFRGDLFLESLGLDYFEASAMSSICVVEAVFLEFT